MTFQDRTIGLAATRLPQAAVTQRRMPLPAEKRSQKYIDTFDALTLVYDAFHDTARQEIVMICPRLLNLWPAFRDGLRLGGVAVGPKLRRRRLLRYEEIRLPFRGAPHDAELAIHVDGAALPVAVGAPMDALFAGRNCLLTQQKDTPVEWIEDWLAWHVATHGADAALIFDNGSTRHHPQALQERLSRIAGLAVCRVISNPFPYGDQAGGRFYVPTKFLQVAMLNLARLRFLGRARGVLGLDVDELLQPMAGTTIFDAVQSAPLGVLSFTGRWVYPDTDDGPQRPRAHGRVAREGGVCRNPKWCLRPGQRAARLDWAVHRPAGLAFPLTHRRALEYWHCFGSSTGWKGGRAAMPAGLVPAPKLVAALNRHLR